MTGRTARFALISAAGAVAVLAGSSLVEVDKVHATAPVVHPVRFEPLANSSRFRFAQVLAFHESADTRRMMPLHDSAMGGNSTGEFVHEDGHGVFRGRLQERERGGAFASVRSIPRLSDLSDYSGLTIRVMGDGQRYQMDLREANLVQGPSWSVEIMPPAGEWVEIAIPFEAFEPRRRNRPAPDAGPLDPGRITSIGFRTLDARPGPFELRISEVSAWAPRAWDI